MKKLQFWSERKALTFIILLAIVLRIALAFRPEPLLYTKYFQEDAFYLFNCAEHLAHGDGFSADGIHPTNGVQPLIVILYAPLFLLSHFDKLLALRFAFGFAALFDSLSIVFLFLLLKTLRKRNEGEKTVYFLWSSPPIIAGLLWATLFPIFFHTVSGLETGVYSTLILAVLYQYTIILKKRRSYQSIPTRRYIALGITLGVCVLARIDAVFFVLTIALYEVIQFRKRGLYTAITISLLAFLVSLPWWYYNYSTFGSLMPQSGMSERLDFNIGWNIWQTLTVIADCVTVFFCLAKMGPVPIVLCAIWTIVIFGGGILLFRKWKLWDYITNRYSIEVLIPLLWTSAIFAVYYTFFFAAPHFIPRYLQPFRIATLIIASMVIPDIYRKLQCSRFKKIILYSFLVAAFANTFLRYPPNFLTHEVATFYQVGKWSLKIPLKTIGMYQTGEAGFLSPNVINLDGKTNYEALRARQEGGIGKYIHGTNIDYIADQKQIATAIVASAERYGEHYVLIDSIKEVSIYKHVR